MVLKAKTKPCAQALAFLFMFLNLFRRFSHIIALKVVLS